MRTVLAAAFNALGSTRVTLALLVEMRLTQTIYLNSSPTTIEYGGNSYVGAGNLGNIEAISDQIAETKPIRFTLSGVPREIVALTLGERVRGKPCFIRLAILHPETHAILDAPLVWTGTLDQMGLTQRPAEDGQSERTIGVSAEHAGVIFERAKPLRYTDADQRRLYPGDTSLRFVLSQSQHEDVWPAASYWKK